MTSFFELSDSKKKNLSLPQLHEFAERLEINVSKISTKTGKEVKKTKTELIEELNEKQFLNKIEKVKKDNKKQKSEKINQKHVPKVLLWIENEKDKFNDEEYKKNMLNSKYLENKYKVKCELGSIVYYGDYYMINKDKEFVLLNVIDSEITQKMEDYLIIPLEISTHLNDPISFFDKLNDARINIGKIELSTKHNFVIDKLNLEKEDKMNGINFNYSYSFKDDKYYLEAELNYLGPKGIFNNNYPKYSFFPKEDISLIQLVDFHNKLSNQQFLFNFKLFGPPETNIEPKWCESLLIKDLNKTLGNKEKNEDSIYDCIIYTTMYSKYKNKENIYQQYEKELNSSEEEISMMLKDFDFLTLIDKNDFNNFIQEYDELMLK